MTCREIVWGVEMYIHDIVAGIEAVKDVTLTFIGRDLALIQSFFESVMRSLIFIVLQGLPFE